MEQLTNHQGDQSSVKRQVVGLPADLNGDFAAGLRTMPKSEVRPDYARGQEVQILSVAGPDFARGQRTLPANREGPDYARGLRGAGQ